MLNGWATTIISGLVLLVAFMQWRTAHQKVVLDLFDRRLQLYNEVNDAVSDFMSTSGNMRYVNARLRLQAAWTESRFLFGEEVSEFIASLRDDIGDLGRLLPKKDADGIDRQTRNAIIDEMVEIDRRVDTSRAPLTELCIPYIRMDQKRVRGLMEYIRDRNRERLSYADPLEPKK